MRFFCRLRPERKVFAFCLFQIWPAETLRFFSSLGLETKVDEKVFPAKGGSEKVINCLFDYLKRGRAQIRNKEALNLVLNAKRLLHPQGRSWRETPL